MGWLPRQLPGWPALSSALQITRTLEQDGTSHEDCRGQAYDKQATMAGVHSGVQM
jgi:hypothetical protein